MIASKTFDHKYSIGEEGRGVTVHERRGVFRVSAAVLRANPLTAEIRNARSEEATVNRHGSAAGTRVGR